MRVEHGLDLDKEDPAIVAAFRCGHKLRDSLGEACTIKLEDAGDDWRICVTRVSDSTEQTDLIPK
jgi:hypothetical protein